MLKRKIDDMGRINIPTDFCRQLEIRSLDLLSLTVIENGFFLAKIKENKKAGLVLQTESNSRIKIPKKIFDALTLNYGDSLFIESNDCKIFYRKEHFENGDNINNNHVDTEYQIKLNLYNEAFNDFHRILHRIVFEKEALTDINQMKIKSYLYVMTKYHPDTKLPEWLSEWGKMILF